MHPKNTFPAAGLPIHPGLELANDILDLYDTAYVHWTLALAVKGN